MSSLLDFSSLSDDQLVELIRAALQEALRRGGAVEAAVRSAGIDEAEKAEIAARAAAREARKLHEEEARRIAAEAAAKVRREAEDAARQKELEKAARIRALAVEARALFGSDQAEFTVKTWEKGADKRLYIGGGYDANRVEFFDTGNSRTAPKTLKVPVGSVLTDLARDRGITADEAKALILAFCEKVCAGWNALNLEVSASNAPRDPACRIQKWLSWDCDAKHPYYLKVGGQNQYTKFASEADRFDTAEQAEAARVAAGKPDTWKPIKFDFWKAFPPKGGN